MPAGCSTGEIVTHLQRFELTLTSVLEQVALKHHVSSSIRNGMKRPWSITLTQE